MFTQYFTCSQNSAETIKMRSITSNSSEADRIGNETVEAYLWFCLPAIVVERIVLLFYNSEVPARVMLMCKSKSLVWWDHFLLSLYSNEVKATLPAFQYHSQEIKHSNNEHTSKNLIKTGTNLFHLWQCGLETDTSKNMEWNDIRMECIYMIKKKIK